MRILSTAALIALFGLASTNAFTTESRQEVRRNKFGAMELIEWNEVGQHKTVMLPRKPFVEDYLQQAEYLNEAQDQIAINQQMLADGNMYTCTGRGESKDDAGYFIPIFVADMTVPGQDYDFKEGQCFKSITFSYAVTDTNVEVTIDAKYPTSLFCKDWFLIGNTELIHVETITEAGIHTISFQNLDEDAMIDLSFGGLKVYMFCDGYIDTFISAFKMILCFVGGLGVDPTAGPIKGSHVPEYMEKANVEFFNVAMNWQLVERPIQEVTIDESLINSGDFLAIFRLDGLDPLIMYGAGSYAGHSTMALRFDGELYVVESQDAWYWPTHGIQRTKFADWIQNAKNADFHVSHMPLNADARARFNEQAAQDFFFQTEGLPYGYHNFLFGWIDTPEQNWPPLLPQQLVPIVFSLFDRFDHYGCDIFFDQAMNFRLGTSGLDVEQLAAAAAERELGLDTVMAMVEQDFWVYTGEVPRDGWAYVCSAYVAALYKAAGLFYDFEINATEFTPRDVYTMNFFDPNFARPQVCVDADPESDWCQLLGKYRMKFPNYSTIAPYAHMNENCPTVAPEYFRPESC